MNDQADECVPDEKSKVKEWVVFNDEDWCIYSADRVDVRNGLVYFYQENELVGIKNGFTEVMLKDSFSMEQQYDWGMEIRPPLKVANADKKVTTDEQGFFSNAVRMPPVERIKYPLWIKYNDGTVEAGWAYQGSIVVRRYFFMLLAPSKRVVGWKYANREV